MSDVVTNPTALDIHNAGAQFDAENEYCEGALGELFRQYPSNTIRNHVYLKVVTLNALYSTQIPLYSDRIPALWEVADQIVGSNVDALLGSGSPLLIEMIAEMRVTGKDRRYNYSFATKYCSWQRPDSYPIFDSGVNEYLWHLRNIGVLKRFKRDLLWDYPEFKKIVNEFRERFGLSDFSFKETGKVLYREGGKLLASAAGTAQSEDQSEPAA
jgi:hypothetical protein